MSVLANHHALITGGGTGIGAAIATALAQAGAAVSIAGRRKAPQEEVTARLPKGKAIIADVTREADCTSMIEVARAAYGPLDIIVANAGLAESAPAARIELDHWRRVIDVNLTGAFLTVKAGLADVTREQTKEVRRIVFVASTGGLKGYPYIAAYCAAKHGVVGLMRALSAELVGRGVTVNAICPGYTETPLLETAVGNISNLTGRSSVDARAELAKSNAHGRLIAPEEIAQTVLWLCSPAGSSVNGQAIAIAGGQL
jgi:NAD(P)-dependent dehydrogenase (short-subunit alcohol dehydrogenase family)